VLGSCRPRIDRQLGEVSLRDGRPALWTSGAREGRRESVLPCSLFLSGAWRAPEGGPPLLRRASEVRRQGSEGEAAGRAPWNAIEPTGDVPGLAVGSTEFRRKRLGRLCAGRGQLAARDPSWLAGIKMKKACGLHRSEPQCPVDSARGVHRRCRLGASGTRPAVGSRIGRGYFKARTSPWRRHVTACARSERPG